eukprot:COSAG06_NODE_1327_length_9855_cov_3.900574_10_plen_82_part_00
MRWLPRAAAGCAGRLPRGAECNVTSLFSVFPVCVCAAKGAHHDEFEQFAIDLQASKTSASCQSVSCLQPHIMHVFHCGGGV